MENKGMVGNFLKAMHEWNLNLIKIIDIKETAKFWANIQRINSKIWRLKGKTVSVPAMVCKSIICSPVSIFLSFLDNINYNSSFLIDYLAILERGEEAIIKKETRKDIALAFIDMGDRLLDIGCGDGSFGSLVLSTGKYKEVYGIDISEDALKGSVKKGLIVNKVDLNKDELPFRDSYFDTITCLDVIEHVVDPCSLLSQVYRVLKPNGILIVSTPNIQWVYHIINLFLGRAPKTSFSISREYDGGHLHYFTYSEMKSILHQSSFKVTNEGGIYLTRWRFIARCLKFFGQFFNLKYWLASGIIIRAVKV